MDMLSFDKYLKKKQGYSSGWNFEDKMPAYMELWKKDYL